MTAQEFADLVAELEWTWKTTADYLVRDERTVRRWKDGDRPIPKKVVEVLDDGVRIAAFEVLRQAREAGATSRVDESIVDENANRLMRQIVEATK